MVWRIDNYTQLLKEARHGKKSIIFSPPFYTGKNGYHMAVSMALYGDGDCSFNTPRGYNPITAKGEYNSIFVTILKGDYDALLAWPILTPIKFTLIDQSPSVIESNDAIHVLRPTATKKNRPFLGRPSGECHFWWDTV